MLRRASIAMLLLAGCSSPAVPPALPPAEIVPLGGDERPVSGETTLHVVGEPAEPKPPREEPPPRLDDTAGALLAAHNRARAAHCARPLVWSPALADEATTWARTLAADDCGFRHSPGSRHGENLAAGTATALDPDKVVAMWMREVASYDFKKPRFGMSTGHFTQVVWKGTTALGCGTSTCKGRTIWVCNYDPAGNVEGAFRDNVAPAGCK